MQRVLLTISFLLIFQIANAQLALTPGYLDLPSTFNPAALGTNVKEGIGMSIYSKKSIDSRFQNSFSSEPSFNSIIRNGFSFYNYNDRINTATDAKNLYFLGYHNTFALSQNTEFTIGGQAQIRQNEEINLTTPQTFGLTMNAHFLLKPKRNKIRYLSNGIQFHLHHYKVNDQVLDILYNEHLINRQLTIQELGAKISNIGYTMSYNLNFHSHRENQKAFNFGFSLSRSKETVIDQFLSDEISGLVFIPQNRIGIKSYINFQKVVNDQFSLELLVTAGEFSASSYFGIGFRINKNSIFRIYTGFSADGTSNHLSIMLNLETKRYKFRTLFGFEPYYSDSVAQFSVAYNLNENYTSTLLRLN